MVHHEVDPVRERAILDALAHAMGDVDPEDHKEVPIRILPETVGALYYREDGGMRRRLEGLAEKLSTTTVDIIKEAVHEIDVTDQLEEHLDSLERQLRSE